MDHQQQALTEETAGSEQRIAVRYVVALVLAVVMTMTLFAAGAAIILRPRLDSRVQRQAESAAGFLAGSVAPGVWNVDERTVASLLEVSLAHDELHFVSVSTEGEVLAERRQPQAAHAALGGYVADPDYVVASRDVIFEDRVIGRVDVAMSRRVVAAELRRSFVIAGLLGAAICAAVAVTSLIVTRQFVYRPMARLRDAADVANRAKSDFLSSMSHELRTPLNGVLGYAQILQRDRGLSAAQRETLESIESCGSHLLTLINDVLDLAKIEAGRLEIEPAAVDLHGLVKAVDDIVRQRAESKGLTFTVDLAPGLPRGIVTDATKLKQVLINLLGNAVKFTGSGFVALRVSARPGERSGERSGARLELIVEDTGIGMSPAELERVFDPFCQAAGGKTSGGTGLGLSISRRIVEAMSGTLTATSEPGAGSAFTIDLPLVEAGSDVLASPDREPGPDLRSAVLAPGQHVAVLIADDRPANRDILRRLLEDAGCETAVAENGREALDHLRERPFDLALMDIRMPVMTGVEAVEQIRADDALKQTVVFAVTATVLPEFRSRATELGFDDVLSKPLRAAELFRRMQEHLGVRFVQPEAEAEAVETVETVETATQAAAAPGLDAADAEKIAARLAVLLEQHNITGLSALAGELIEQGGGSGAVGREIRRLVTQFDFQALAGLLATLRPRPGGRPDG